MMHLILTNENDEAIGEMEKMEVHRKGALHRAFSIFIFNDKKELLLQKRADNKYHSAGLWTNTCCSHPYPGEEMVVAAQKRLQEEMGFSCPVKKIFEFIYRADVGNGLIEHEYDHVFAGKYNGPVKANAGEVSDHCFASVNTIKSDLEVFPERYTAWFEYAFPLIENYLSSSDADHLFS